MDDEKSLMDDLATAWDEAEQPEAETPPAEEPPPEAPVEEPAAPAAPEPEATAAPTAVEAPAGEPLEAEPATQEADLNVAPKGLSPAAREDWAATPESVRREIAKRERDFEQGIQKYAENARRAERMDGVMAPYQSLFAMNGGARNVLPGLLQTAQALQTGSDHVRAETLANLMQQFGVSAVNLANVLEGKALPRQQQQQAPNIQQEIQKALAPMFQQQQQERLQEAQAELAAFSQDPANDFYSDVRNEMADLIDVASKNGQQLSLKDAYNRACMMRDDIRQIIQARESSNQLLQRRAAAASISGAPQGQEAPPQPESITDYLAQAWDQVGNQ